MKKEKICKSCHRSVVNDYLCDTCGTNLEKKYIGIPITVDFSYGHSLDGETYHFCTFTCLLKFITAELKKTQSKETRFEYGKEE